MLFELHTAFVGDNWTGRRAGGRAGKRDGRATETRRRRADTHSDGAWHVDGAFEYVLLADVGERAGRQYNVAVFDLVGDVTHAERVRASEVGRVAGTAVYQDDDDYDNDNDGGGRWPRPVQRRRRRRIRSATVTTAAAAAAVDWTDCARPLGKLSQTAGRT